MKLVDNWKSCWKWYSMHPQWVQTAAISAWTQLPPEWKVVFPPRYMISLSVAMALLTIIVGIVGWAAKTAHSNFKDLQIEHKKLNDFVLTNYHPKNDINAILTEIKESMAALHKRLDSFFSKGG